MFYNNFILNNNWDVLVSTDPVYKEMLFRELDKNNAHSVITIAQVSLKLKQLIISKDDNLPVNTCYLIPMSFLHPFWTDRLTVQNQVKQMNMKVDLNLHLG